MRTLHLGLRVADRERSIAFCTTIGFEVLGEVSATEHGSLTMPRVGRDIMSVASCVSITEG